MPKEKHLESKLNYLILVFLIETIVTTYNFNLRLNTYVG